MTDIRTSHSHALSNAVAKLKAAAGRVAGMQVAKKKSPPSPRIIAHPSGSNTGFHIPGGRRAITFETSDPLGAGNILKPGDRVDVVFVDEQNSGGQRPLTLVSGLPVLAADQTLIERKDDNTDKKSGLAESSVDNKKEYTAVTLAAKPDEYDKIIQNKLIGTIRLIPHFLSQGTQGAKHASLSATPGFSPSSNAGAQPGAAASIPAASPATAAAGRMVYVIRGSEVSSETVKPVLRPPIPRRKVEVKMTTLRASRRQALGVVFGLFLAMPRVVSAAPEKRIEMAVGESIVLKTSHVESVAVGNPAVADVVLFPNRDDQVLINAKSEGLTTFILWDGEGQQSYTVFVARAATRLETVVYALKNYALTAPVYDSKTTKLTMEPNHANMDNLTTTLTSLLGAGNFSLDVNSARVTLQGTESGIASAIAALDNLDKPVGQVLIEVRIVELTEGDLKDIGVTLGAQKGSSFASATFNADGNELAATFDTFTSLQKRFNITLEMLNQLTVGNTLVNPKITAKDGNTAWILVGEKFPIASRDRDGLLSFNYINTGIILAINPRISDDGFINLWLKPEVSAITGWVGDPTSSANNAAPIISTREAMTDLRVRDGEPVVIGGLKRSQDTVIRSKVPVLGDVPLVGKLFRRKYTTSQNSELVIIITPHILKPGENVSELDYEPAALQGTITESAGKSGSNNAVPAGK